jgi:HAD superfamily hydrolase (TIGR01509 family)
VLRPFGLELTWDFYRRHGIGSTDRVLLDAVLQAAGSPLTADALLEHWPAKQEAFRRRILTEPPITPAISEFIKALGYYSLAVVTSSQICEIEPALVAAGIRPCFAALVGAADVARHKPAPDAYLTAAARLGARRPLVIEDSDAGVASAQAAGFDVLRVSSPAEMPAAVARAVGSRTG